MAAEQLTAFVGNALAFTYEGEPRLIDLEKVQQCKNGNTVFIGKDHDRNMAHRSFTLAKATNIIPIIA